MTPNDTLVRFREGYKYQLAENHHTVVSIFPSETIKSEFITLEPTGKLTIRRGYAWDGPSGPTLDTRCSMRGSLVHDALYQLLREGSLPQSARDQADEELYRRLKEDGMWGWRAWLWRREVKKFAGAAADPRNRKTVLNAP